MKVACFDLVKAMEGGMDWRYGRALQKKNKRLGNIGN
jgi:hypothetical protein